MNDERSELPGALSPSEERIIAYLREGTPDAEIAVRVGVSVGDLKDRIERLKTRFGAKDRAELIGAPSPAAVPLPAPAPAYEWVIGGEEPVIGATPFAPPLAPRPGRLRAMLPTIAGLAAVTVLVAGAATYWLTRVDRVERTDRELLESSEVFQERIDQLVTSLVVEVSDDGPIPNISEPNSAPSDKVMVGDTGIEARPFVRTPPVPIPDGLAMIIAEGCYQCDGPTTAITRIWAQEGRAHRDILFVAPPSDGPHKPYIHSYAVSPNGLDLVVSVCSSPGCVWHDTDAAPGSEITVYRSANGGATWTEFAKRPGDSFIEALDGERVLLRQITERLGNTQQRLFAIPGDETVEGPLRASARPITTDYGLGWTDAEGRFTFWGGETTTVRGAAYLASVIPDGYGGYHAVWLQLSNNRALTLVGYVLADGFVRWAAWLGEGETAGIAGFAGDAGLVGNASFPGEGGTRYRPALINALTAEISEITGPFAGGRDFVVAANMGQWARVDTPGDCLNLRASPTADAGVLACVADNTMLFTHADPPDDPPGWLFVSVPRTGINGWAKTEYLER